MNDYIKCLLKDNCIYHWVLAEEMKIHESTLSRWFRHKLSDEQETQIKAAVETIKLSRKKDN